LAEAKEGMESIERRVLFRAEEGGGKNIRSGQTQCPRLKGVFYLGIGRGAVKRGKKKKKNFRERGGEYGVET